MTNILFSVKNHEGTQGWLTCPINTAKEYSEMIANFFAEVKPIRAGEMKLEEVPEEIREEVLETLKAFNICSVIFEYGKFRVMVGACIRSEYNFDYFYCGDYRQDEAYTPEERRQNYRELFGGRRETTMAIKSVRVNAYYNTYEATYENGEIETYGHIVDGHRVHIPDEVIAFTRDEDRECKSISSAVTIYR